MIFLTGGTGRLGKALTERLGDVSAPPRSELDLLNPAQIASALERIKPELVVHCAAYTDVAGGETERDACWNSNVIGTRNLVKELSIRNIPMVHISSDYVFWGDVGNYKEDDTPGPVRNFYSLSKLVSEESVRQLQNHLVIRTSFRISPWPYPKAYTDLFTSQGYLDEIAPEVAMAIQQFPNIPFATLHIASKRQSAYELAHMSNPDVEAASKASSNVPLPEDISLNQERWQALKKSWENKV